MTKKTAKIFATSRPESMESTFTQWVSRSIRIGDGIYLPDKRVISGSGTGLPVRLKWPGENVLNLQCAHVSVFRATMPCFALFSVINDIIFIFG